MLRTAAWAEDVPYVVVKSGGKVVWVSNLAVAAPELLATIDGVRAASDADLLRRAQEERY